MCSDKHGLALAGPVCMGVGKRFDDAGSHKVPFTRSKPPQACPVDMHTAHIPAAKLRIPGAFHVPSQ